VTTVAVVDDQELVRLGLRTLINSEADLDLVGEAADGRAGLG
jgi:DNA-binding NarL/FixJ family response regulator